MPTTDKELTVLTYAKDIVCAFLQKNPLDARDLPGFVEAVHTALRSVDLPKGPQGPTPAVPIDKSVFPDHIICLETGRKFLTLTKHLTAMGMTPAAYRAKWGLPASYPMNAPSFSASRADKARAAAIRVRARPEPNDAALAAVAGGAPE